MAWYQKNAPEMHPLLAEPYNINLLLNNKESLLHELPKNLQLQQFVAGNSMGILEDCLRFALEAPTINCTYQRKYMQPTRAIELITNEFLWGSLSWQKSLVQACITKTFKYFSSVDPHIDNTNLYHAYLQRILRMLFFHRSVNKCFVLKSIQQQQGVILQTLYSHSHKLSISACLDMIMTADFMDPDVVISGQLKINILTYIFEIIGLHDSHIQKAEVCAHVVKTILQKCINFLADRRKIPNLPPSDSKIQSIIILAVTIRNKLNILQEIVTKSRQNSFRVIIFEILQLQYILGMQQQLRKKLPPKTNQRQLFKQLLQEKSNITTPLLIDWLIIIFAQVGCNQRLEELFLSLDIMRWATSILVNNRNNNIIAMKVFQLLKIAFHCACEAQVPIRLENSKISNLEPCFRLLTYCLSISKELQSVVRSFRSINQPLFSLLYLLFRIYAQLARNVDLLFSLNTHLQVCQQMRQELSYLIEFQNNQPCFVVYERQIGRDLGKFYSDDMFTNLKPTQFTVKRLQPKIILQPTQIKKTQITITTIEDNNNLIQCQMPSNQQLQNLRDFTKSQNPQKKTVNLINLKQLIDTELPSILQNQPIQIQVIQTPKKKIKDQQQVAEVQNTANFDTFMRGKLKEIDSNSIARRSKSKTPTKMKNQLKKAKNKWAVNQDEQAQQSASIVIQRQRPNSAPKTPIKQLQFENIRIIRMNKSKLKTMKSKQSRLINQQNDGRLINWLKDKTSSIVISTPKCMALIKIHQNNFTQRVQEIQSYH